MTDTHALIKIRYDKPDCWNDTEDSIISALSEAEYSTLDETGDADIALLYPIDSSKEDATTIEEGINSLLLENSLPIPNGIEIIILSSGNVEDWAGYIAPHTDEDVVRAIVEDDSSYYLNNPERIEDTANDTFIGRFGSEDDVAAMLAEGDPKIQALDEDIFDALDLVKYYSDTIQYETWRDDELWFWNR